jgi:hypothetical protein
VDHNFWARLDRSGGCWLWTGAKDPKGYGVLKVASRSWKAHRYAWLLSRGREPQEGGVVVQTCGHPSCCQPDHLLERTGGRQPRKARRPSGAGSVAEVRPGVWELRVSSGRNPKTGTYDRVTRTFEGAEVSAGTVKVGSETMDALF